MKEIYDAVYVRKQISPADIPRPPGVSPLRRIVELFSPTPLSYRWAQYIRAIDDRTATDDDALLTHLTTSLQTSITHLQTSLTTRILLGRKTASSLARALTARLNALTSPLLRLPPPLLVRIIYDLADAWTPHFSHCHYGFPRSDSTLGWITLSHVCSSLRHVPLAQHPALWARAVCVFPRAVDELLRRAGDAPLTLNTGGYACVHAREVWAIVVNRADSRLRRARVLEMGYDDVRSVLEEVRRKRQWDAIADTAIHDDRTAFDPKYPALTPDSGYPFDLYDFPYLEHLSLTLHSTHNIPPAWTDASSFAHGSKPLLLPSLRTLRLNNVLLNISSRSLTRLSLSFGPGTQTSERVYMPASAFLEMLSVCEGQLEVLELDDFIPLNLPLRPATTPSAHLLFYPHLETLSLSDTLPRIKAFLSYFDLNLSRTTATALDIRFHSLELNYDMDRALDILRSVVGRDSARRDSEVWIGFGVYQPEPRQVVLALAHARSSAGRTMDVVETAATYPLGPLRAPTLAVPLRATFETDDGELSLATLVRIATTAFDLTSVSTVEVEVPASSKPSRVEEGDDDTDWHRMRMRRREYDGEGDLDDGVWTALSRVPRVRSLYISDPTASARTLSSAHSASAFAHLDILWLAQLDFFPLGARAERTERAVAEAASKLGVGRIRVDWMRVVGRGEAGRVVGRLRDVVGVVECGRVCEVVPGGEGVGEGG